MRRWLVLLVGVLGIAPAFAAGITPQQLTDEYVAAVHAAYPKATVTVIAPLQVRVQGEAGGEGTSFLNNLYAQILQDPSRKQDLLQRHVMSLSKALAGDEAESLATENIVPLVKDQGWLKDMSHAGATHEIEFVYDSLNEDLLVVYGEDAPTSVQYFTRSVFDKSGVARKDLRALALKNLRGRLESVSLLKIEGVRSITAGGDFDASLLLLDEVWNKQKLRVKGDFVVAIPARNLLLFADSSDAREVEALARLAQEVVSQDTYALTSQLFIRRDGALRRYKPST